MKTFTNCAEKKAKQFLNLLQGYTRGIRMTAILILLLVGVTNAWAGGGIYLKPNSNWTQANARFAAYFFKRSNNSDSKWMSMYASNKKGYYVCAIPDGYDMVILCRMNPSANDNNWNNRWNQTGNLNVPSDEKIVCSINSGQWDCGDNVTWSAINWYIAGDFNGWNTTANEMPCDISIESGDHTMKIVSEYGDWFGNTGTMIRGNSSGWTMTYGENSNCTLTADVAGTYNFSCTGTKLTVTYPEECLLCGNFVDNWKTTYSILNKSVTIKNLKAGTYEFKIHRYDATSAYWVSNDGTMTRENCSDWTMYDDVDKNCKITADFDGDYEFTYDRSNGKLSVTYPTAYKVTYGVGTNKGTASVTTNPNILSDSLALPSTSITFSKGATIEGYTWKGWYSKTDGTGTKWGDGTTYTSTNRTGDITVYACYDLNTYNIIYNTNGGTNPNDAPTSYNVTTNDITLPTPTKTGYTFAGWYDNAGLTGNEITQIAQGSTDHKEFWAKWTANQYTINYKDQGGSNFSGTHADGHPTTHTYDTETQLLTPSKTGYTFGGWFTTSACTGSAVTSLGATDYTADITLYAKWTANTNTPYVVKHYQQNILNDDYTLFETENLTGTTDTQVTPQVKDYEGFTAPATQTVTIAAAGTLVVEYRYTRNSYTLTWDVNNGNALTGNYTSGNVKYAATVTAPSEPTRTGYDFSGWHNGTNITTPITTMPASDITYTAQWTPNTYTVNLSQTGAATQGTTSVTATYDADMPSATMPTAANGYVFMGYWDSENGEGTQYYDANGASAHTWDKTEEATLYAHFVKVEITAITLDKSTFEPVEAGREGYVTATPTLEPTPTNDVIVCWRLLYNKGNEVPGRSAQVVEGNTVKFSIAGLAAGTYKIEAVLRAGSNCGSGEPLSTLTKNFIIASEYTVTVKYTCDNQEIKASTTAPAHATKPTTLIAPDIFGYAFSGWEAGDGVEIKTTSGDGKTITYTAIYNGTITAKYTKKKLIYFKRPADWGTTIYYYNIGSEDKWKNNIDGVKWGLYTKDITHGAIKMTRIGDSDVYYYDYEATPNTNDDPGLYIAFADAKQDGREPIGEGDQTKCHVSWPIEHTRSFNEGTPMFVAANYIHYYWGANYYNAGYWTNYVGETGYTLKIYDKKDGGRKELYSIPFEAATTDNNIPFKAVVDLEAGKTYGFKFVRANGIWYKNDKDGTMTNSSHTDWPFIWDDTDGNACGITTTAAGEYTFTLNLNNATGDLQISVDYPAAEGDYRILYRDNGEENWSGNTRPQNWCHPSRIIKKKDGANDTISFFINKDKEPQLLYQTIKSINDNTGAITWNAAKEFEDVKWNVIEKDGVINFTFTQSKGAIAVTNIELYKGNYYIRVDAVDGQWGHYKTNADNCMTYSAFSESDANSFGEKFSHYKTKWCPRETNVKFTIANDYSPCITDTLIRDITRTWDENMDDGGKLYTDNSQDPTADKYSANIRFMWNRNTNKISRAYLSSATNVTKKFLILQGDDKMKDAEGKEIAATEHVPADATLLDDKQNWIYETTIKVQPGARVKLYACYATPEGQNDIATAQYFRGTNAAFSESSTVQILGGTGETWYTMRVIYDFKTNRLMGAWVPSGDITGEVAINADVMIMREHQEDATCITLSNDDSKLTLVKTVYGAIRFNRWTLNNRDTESHEPLPLVDQKSIYERGLYFISFPFDVHLSNAFGLGTYGTHWVISEYNGLRRAQRGYFEEDCINEDCTNWDYIWEPDTFVMKANVGYLLSLDLELMKYDDVDNFWKHNIENVELFFPSTTTLETIQKTSYTMPELGEKYQCKINHNTDGEHPSKDRTVKDSYWRCIGVPSFANYAGLLQQGDEKQNITWQPDGDNFPFLYEWNTTDNSLQVQNTSNYTFRPTFAYLIQNGNTIHWSAVNTPTPAAIAARTHNDVRHYEWKITVSRNEQQEDQTFLRMTEQEYVSAKFDFGQDLAKEFNYNRADIYTLIGYEKAAANSLPLSEQTTVIPLGLDIEQAGDYTIAMPEGVENIGITLVDNETGIHTNLSAGQEYTLTLHNGICENRLFIEVSPIQNTPTDLEYTTEDTREQTTRKMLIDGILYLIRDGVIYDAQGHRL